MSSRLEFPLAQAFAKGLTLCFEDEKSSTELDNKQFLMMEQVHGAEIREIGPRDMEKGTVGPCDGIVAVGDWFRGCGKGLAIKTADCLPLIYVDFQNGAVGAVHAGWRGLQKKIHLKPFEMGYFDPVSTWVWVGPSLNGKSFEVGPDMYNQFPQKNNPRFFEPAQGDKRYFYPWRLVEDDLNALKINLVYNVEEDTLGNTDFASYRRQKGGTRNISWARFL